MRHLLPLLSLCVLLAFTTLAVAAEGPGTPQTKTGTIKSVDATAKTFVMTIARDLTFNCTEKTTYTLDGKESTFDAAVKADRKATVTYTRDTAATDQTKARIASRVDAVSAAPAK